MRIVALSGGVGASKLLLGLARAMNPAELSVIVNTGDDLKLYGLHISPDLDIVTYTLAGLVNPQTGWGFAGDTFHALETLARYGQPEWFRLGDRDLATHIFRTGQLRSGATLSEVTTHICRALGVESRILPMSDQYVPTQVETDRGWMHFQEYMVQHRAEPAVKGLAFRGADSAVPAPGVLEAIREAEQIIICPSNPLISIGPILAVPGIRDALRSRRNAVVAVSPLVGGKSLKGPSDRMMAELGYDVSAAGIARMYADIVKTTILDEQDAPLSAEIEKLEMHAILASTVMRNDDDKMRLAQIVLANSAVSHSARSGQ